jgi:WD40 repeat protein
VKCFNWSADGDRLLFLARGQENNYCRLGLFERDHPSESRSVDVLGEPIDLGTLAPDGRHALVATFAGSLAWIDLRSHKSSILIESSGVAALTAIAISDDQNQFAAASSNGQILLGDPRSRTVRVLTAAEASSVVDLHFSRTGKQVVCARTDGSIGVWDLASAARLWNIAGHDGPASAAEFLPDGNHVISTGFDGIVRIWETSSGREVWQRYIGTQGPLALAVAFDGSKAAWGGINEAIVVWNLELERVDGEFETPGLSIRHLEFSPDGNTLAVAGNYGVIRRFDLKTGAEMSGFDTGSEARSSIVAGPLHSQ